MASAASFSSLVSPSPLPQFSISAGDPTAWPKVVIQKRILPRNRPAAETSYMKALILAGFLVAGSIQPLSALSIPSNARIFVEASDGFEMFLTVALEKKHVPLAVIADKSRAAFVLEGSSSALLVDLKSGDVIFACSVAGKSTIRGWQIAAESCAKHLGDAVSRPNRKHLRELFSKDPALDFQTWKDYCRNG
jgi:hypothetical protein